MGNSQTSMVAGEVPIGSRAGQLVIGTTVFGSAVAMLTATVVNVALPSIAADFDASASTQQWIVNSYLLTISAFILVGGNLGDRLGRVKVYRVGVLWFAVASLLCAIAPSTTLLIAARLLQGVGGALLTPGSLAIIESTLRKEDRGLGVGRWSAFIGVAGAVGPLVGGLLVDLSWRYVFLINLPVAVAALLMSLALPESRDPEANKLPMDLSGAALTAIALGGLSIFAIEFSTGSPVVVMAGRATVAATVALIRAERRRPGGVVPLDLFADSTFTAANLITLAVYGGMGMAFFLIPIQLQVTAGFSPLEAGAAFLPSTMALILLSSRAGDLAQRIGPRTPLTVGPALIALSLILFIRIGPDANYLIDVFPGALILGLGLAASVAPVTATALGSAPDQRSGAASAMNNAVSRAGQLLAISALPAIVGLRGSALSDPLQLDAEFPAAMIVSAVIVGAGSAVAVLLLPSQAAGVPPVRKHHIACPVDGAHPHRTAEALSEP